MIRWPASLFGNVLSARNPSPGELTRAVVVDVVLISGIVSGTLDNWPDFFCSFNRFSRLAICSRSTSVGSSVGEGVMVGVVDELELFGLDKLLFSLPAAVRVSLLK